MSCQESHVGKIMKMNDDPKFFEETCKVVCSANGYNSLEVRGYKYDSWEELINEEMYDTFFTHKGIVYKIVDDECFDGIDMYHVVAAEQRDGTIDFTVSYYNRGCGLHEALKNVIDNMEKKINFKVGDKVTYLDNKNIGTIVKIGGDEDFPYWLRMAMVTFDYPEDFARPLYLRKLHLVKGEK